ncbi:MAG TPA: hypothetical protein VGC62_06000 [Pseudomonas sp.]|jgi:hypothetical protein|uniref:hypothetical protein n=1 Tax=Pseudomonas sp. TaxID=306 RepID=UPI002ED9C729
MKRQQQNPRSKEVDPEHNQVGLLAWSLLAHPQLNMVGGGIPGQPNPDTPNDYPQPEEPGEPTLPDEPPPAPVA